MSSIFDPCAIATLETDYQQKAVVKSNIFIPPRFEEAVHDHADLFSSRTAIKTVRAPLILIIAGPPGGGKTRMAEAALQNIGIVPHTVSASVLGGEYEGQSVKPLIDAYMEAEGEGGQCGALILDDFDLSAGRVDAQQSGTINSSLLNSALMNLADNPYEVRVSHANKPTTTYPVDNPPILVITANDTGKIYKPLKRSGRSFVFEWQPKPSELIKMVGGLYPALSKTSVKKLVTQFSGQSIAFYEQLGYSVARNLVRDYRKERQYRALDFLNLADSIESTIVNCKLHQLIRAGEAMLSTDTAKSYLSDTKTGN